MDENTKEYLVNLIEDMFNRRLAEPSAEDVAEVLAEVADYFDARHLI